jgi:DNA polymerase-1
LGNEIRKAIIAPTGSYLLSADYSQIDLRALAHLSQDAALISSFNNDEDIHSITAARIFEVDPQEVTAKMRRDAKAINFGVIYGMSDYGLARATGMTRDEAANFIARYFERYPDVRKFLDRTKMEARKLGYVKTLLGRKRFLSEVNSENRIIRESAERMAINAPVQGTSADIIKVAMLEIYRRMHEETMSSKMLLQIHDELLFEVPENELESMKNMVTVLMSKAVQLSVPLKITVKVGRNWGEMAAY